MGSPKLAKPVLLFTGILFSENSQFQNARDSLVKTYGSAFMETAPRAWNRSEYYRDELGWPILRIFLFFKKLVNPADLPDIKLTTNSIEKSLSINDKRTVNIDPGYLTLHNIVLATTKNYSHRIYLSHGIYGEITLLYKQSEKTYSPFIFTYPDYQDEETIAMFLKARKFLKKSDKNEGDEY